jgi:hypothetical protein
VKGLLYVPPAALWRLPAGTPVAVQATCLAGRGRWRRLGVYVSRPDLLGVNEPIKVPRPASLRKYGLDAAAYVEIAARQNFACFVCEKLPPSLTLDVDHQHVRGFAKLPPAQRRRHVRGLLCRFCNMRLVAKGMTAAKAARVALYLAAFDARMTGGAA